MTTLREAAQQALEALEWADNAMYEGTPIQANTQKAITTLRAALVEQPAEPQQEPVAWQHRKPIEDSYGNTRGASDWLPGKGLEWWPHRALYAAPPARNQCKFPLCQNEDYQQALAEQIKQELYTGEPAQRKPLTDEEICAALDIDGSDDWTFTVAYAIIDAYERKNGVQP